MQQVPDDEYPDTLVWKEVVVQRWFIIDSVRSKAGQYKLTLRRDLIADYYNIITQSPMFIEKATLPSTDLMIYNSENMTYNQIKRSQTPLKDKSGCPWLVGYIPRDFTEDGAKVIRSEAYVEGVADYEVDSLEDYTYYDELQQNTYDPTSLEGTTYIFINAKHIYQNTTPKTYWIGLGFNEAGSFVNPASQGLKVPSGVDPNSLIQGLYAPYVWNNSKYNDIGPAIIQKYTPTVAAQTVVNAMSVLGLSPSSSVVPIEEQGKVIYDKSTGKYYQVSIEETGSITTDVHYTVGTAAYEYLVSYLTRTYTSSGTSYSLTGDPNLTTFMTRLSYTGTRGRLVPLTVNVQATVEETRFHLDDNPYDMFFIPFSDDITIINMNEQHQEERFTTNKSSAMAIAANISATLGSGQIFDLQLLPYCPMPELIVDSKTLDVSGKQPTFIREYTESEGEVILGDKLNVMLWGIKSSFTVTDLNVSYVQSDDPIEKKIKSETQIYRLCSPNYQGLFEFNPEKNGGFSSLQAKCTYLPFSPFIHVSPVYNEGYLYGKDFNDVRGLTCQGDFSLPQLNDQWANYQQNNKSYQAAFSRDIQNMEVNNAVQMERERWQIASGVFSGAAGGAIAGAQIGGGYGAAAGALIGGTASMGAGIRDYQLNQILRDEAIDYRKDQFGYSLQNIKAMPQSISKASPLTIVNQIYPTLEIYTATPEEENALRNKIKYNGMTVMRIGIIQEFLNNKASSDEYMYIKGQLIRFEDLGEDFHVVNSIAGELVKGAYFELTE